MRLLIVLTSHDRLGTTGRPTGFYLSELTHALEVFDAAGVQWELASPKGGAAPVDGAERTDAANRRYLDDPTFMTRVANTLRLSDVDPGRFDGVYVPGGHGTMFDLPDDAQLQRIVRQIAERQGVVSAVCHGPAALVNVKGADGRPLISGRAVAGFSNEEEAAAGLTQVMPFLLEDVLSARGGRYSKAATWAPHVQVDGQWVTGQNPASAAGVAREVVRLLTGARH